MFKLLNHGTFISFVLGTCASHLLIIVAGNVNRGRQTVTYNIIGSNETNDTFHFLEKKISKYHIYHIKKP